MLILVGLQIALELMSIGALTQMCNSAMRIAAEWIADAVLDGAVVIVIVIAAEWVAEHAVIVIVKATLFPFSLACRAVDVTVATLPAKSIFPMAIRSWRP